MKNLKLQKYRRSFLGTAMVLFSFLLLFGCNRGKDTDKNSKQSATTTLEVTTSCTTSTMTSTTSSLTTSSTTTTELMTIMETTEMIVWENTVPIETQAYIPPVTEAYVAPVTHSNDGSYSESDAILMAQVINKEASATYDGKLAVASVILNRSNYYGQSIADVVYAPNQFSVVGYLGSYTDDDYNAAVQVLTGGSVNNAYYFDGNHPDRLNHFRDVNNNYIGAW